MNRKDLAKYLADYIEHEYHWRGDELENVLEQGIDAFESTEDCTIEFETIEWLNTPAECENLECADCSLTLVEQQKRDCPYVGSV